jgi:UDP-2,3-diacylglucosamine pyrophosphatase LpxH
MWNIEELFILSDLHLAAERDKGLFQSDAELAACLRWIRTDTRDSITVLAGDVLDFLVLTDGNTKFDFARLGDHTQAIVEHHPEVFTALADLAVSPHHQLVIMGGNHDAELAFPSVQEVIERHLGGNFLNGPVRWLVHGEALRVRVGEAVTLVEHGNVLDPWNRINHAALQSACSLSSRNLGDAGDYQPPPGSRLVLEVVSRLRGSYQWVDCLKPETEAVLPLLWHFAPRQQQKLIFNLAEEYLSMKVFALNKKIGNARNPERLYKGEREVENSPQDLAFKEWVDEVYAQERPTLGDDKRRDKLLRKLRLVSARDTFFELERPDDSANYLRPIYEGGADLVVHGHTHSAKACVLEGGLYINTGTWGQLLRLPPSYEGDEVWQKFLDLLRKNDVECFRRPTFARIRRDRKDNATTATLLEWQRQGPEALTTRRFSDRQRGWRRD